MSSLRLVLWNMEWLNDLFVPDAAQAQFRPDGEKPEHSKDSTVKQRCDDLFGVLRELSPDVVVAVEAPSRPEEFRLFFDRFELGTWVADVQSSGLQNIGIAVRTDENKFKQPPFVRWDTKNDHCFDPFLIDTDNDDIEERHTFARRPLYAEIYPQEGVPFRILGLHLKSKGIFDVLEWSKWWDKADANRKKILAEATHIRESFLDPYLTDNKTREIPLIVCGDINDGPGLDASERKLLGSGVERIMGTVWKPNLCLESALFDALDSKDQKKLNFSGIYTTRYPDPIFNYAYQRDWIDHILYSRCQLKSWVRNARIHSTMPDGTPTWKKYKHASDHFPLSVEVATV